jgi:hypothetical protein
MFINILIRSLILIFVIGQLFSCKGDINISNQINDNKLIYINTNYGGCNGITTFTKNRLHSFAKNDTVFYLRNHDTLKVYIGQNYICCAPFKVIANQKEIQLDIIIKDTCNFPIESCYCRCMCYYEFEVIFLAYYSHIYHLNIYLEDPRQDQTILINQLIIK